MAGKTVDNVEALEIVTYDGTRMRVGPAASDDGRGDAGAAGAELRRRLAELGNH